MVNYSKSPTEENFLNTLTNDVISRSESVFRFIQFLDLVTDCRFIAIDAPWGNGKTFFVNQVKLVLDALNPQTVMEQEKRDMILSIHSTNFKTEQTYSTLYYDAWKNDNDEDPLLSIMYSAIKNNCAFSTTEDTAIIKSFLEITQIFVPIVNPIKKIFDSVEKLQAESILADLKKQKQSEEKMTAFWDYLISENGGRLAVFIDELDRCSPAYAVKLLERIKHYCIDERITFIFSTSLNQLAHTIKHYYGEGYDATRYLDRFFDYRMGLSPIDIEDYSCKQLNFPKTTEYFKIAVHTCIQYFNFSLRELERYIPLVKMCAEKVATTHVNDFGDQNAFAFSVRFFMPVALGLHFTDLTAYDDFINGNNIQILYQVYNKNHLGREFGELCARFLGIEKNDPNRDILTSECLETAYNALFKQNYTHSIYEVKIGSLQFTNKTRQDFYQLLSLLSPHATYRI